MPIWIRRFPSALLVTIVAGAGGKWHPKSLSHQDLATNVCLVHALVLIVNMVIMASYVGTRVSDGLLNQPNRWMDLLALGAGGTLNVVHPEPT